MQELIDVNNLLKDEVSQANMFMKRAREILEPIYMSAAKKLIDNDLVKDQSEICARLAKIFGPEHERQLRRYLPEKYKRGYIWDETKEMPKDLTEEYVKLTRDLFGKLFEAWGVVYRKFNNEPQGTPIHDSLKSIIMTQFGQLSELESRIEEIKNLHVEVDYSKELQDERQKIGDFEKIMLKIQLFFINKDHVGKMIDISPKWIKNGVENDPELVKALNTIRQCPFCKTDIADWFNKQIIRRSKGLPIESIPIYANLQ